MSQAMEELKAEVVRLYNLTDENREENGVYAKASQLKFLSKKLNSSRNTLPVGIEKFVCDMASSDSKILELLDKARGV